MKSQFDGTIQTLQQSGNENLTVQSIKNVFRDGRLSTHATPTRDHGQIRKCTSHLYDQAPTQTARPHI